MAQCTTIDISKTLFLPLSEDGHILDSRHIALLKAIAQSLLPSEDGHILVTRHIVLLKAIAPSFPLSEDRHILDPRHIALLKTIAPSPPLLHKMVKSWIIDTLHF